MRHEFQALLSYAHNGGGLAIGDFNGDGFPDLVIGENVPASAACVYFGNGDGTFRAGPCSQTGIVPENCAAADFNGDGNLDLVFSNPGDTQIYVLLGNGDGTFEAPIPSSISGYGAGITASDLNGDARPDLVVALTQFGIVESPLGVAVLLGNGDETFGAPSVYPLG